MRRLLALAAFILVMSAIPLGVCRAEYTIWYSPLTFTTIDPLLTIAPTSYGSSAPAILVTTNGAAEGRFMDLGLTLPNDVVIEGVTICYAIPNARNYISELRLTSMTTPGAVTFFHIDPTNLTQIGQVCYRSTVHGASVTGTTTLTVSMDFQDAHGSITIGAIEVHVSDVPSGVESEGDQGQTGELQLRANRPNPFSSPTMIEYALERDGEVELQICDVTGRNIRMLFHGMLAAGEQRFVWDGRDDSGREMPSGTYYYQVRMGDQVGSRGMILIR